MVTIRAALAPWDDTFCLVDPAITGPWYMVVKPRPPRPVGDLLCAPHASLANECLQTVALRGDEYRWPSERPLHEDERVIVYSTEDRKLEICGRIELLRLCMRLMEWIYGRVPCMPWPASKSDSAK
jgi:hypothetical protein